MLQSPGVSVSQIAAELGIEANVLGRWRRDLRQKPEQAVVGVLPHLICRQMVFRL
jgi:transposase-like protein